MLVKNINIAAHQKNMMRLPTEHSTHLYQLTSGFGLPIGTLPGDERWGSSPASEEMSSELDDVDPIPPWNFKWVMKDELAIMGYPKSKENVKFLVDKGITHVVSLSPEKQPPFEYFPFHFRWTPIDVLEYEAPTLDQVVAFINTCKVAVWNKEAVAVHCRLGRGRSGTMAACYLVHFYKIRPEKAVTEVRLLQPGAIETYSQEKVVSAYYDLIRSRLEEELMEQVDAFIGSLPRPKWDFKFRPRKFLDYDD